MQLVDIGVNLAHDSFDVDREAVVARARDRGVVQMVITGSSLSSTRRAVELVRERRGILRATAGVHPHHASELGPQSLEELRALAALPEVAAVGECGLDYFRDFSPRAVQREAFAAQLALAAEVGKPVFLHQRDAHADFVAILRERIAQLRGGVAHCFTGGREELETYLDLGLAIGITGWICDERRGGQLRESVAYVPSERLMVETDAPYLLPRDLAPMPTTRRNEPMWLPHVAAAVARARGEAVEKVAADSTRNARALFGLPELV
jgi:TatD DNase family protein